MKIINNNYKGTRILLGNEKREFVNQGIDLLKTKDFVEISIPILQKQEVFKSKVGEENNNLMFKFKDNGDRDVCLAPEYTAIIQMLALDLFKYEKDLKLFYIQECFRGERPQKGRYRQFTQFGVEIINPVKTSFSDVIELAESLVSIFTKDYKVTTDVTRGLDYYKHGKGFEISCPQLETSSQVCGGGEYEGGIGFAIGVDRLLLLT